MNLNDISWPVFILGKKRPIEEESVLFYIINDKYYILDDKTLEADSLAGRRLKLRVNNIQLYKLNRAIFFLGDFIKLAKKGIWFIDSTGEVFTYTKSKFVPLVCKKITKIIPSVSCSLIEVSGLSVRFKVLFRPTMDEKYAGLLKLGAGYIFYGFYSEHFDSTVRKV